MRKLTTNLALTLTAAGARVASVKWVAPEGDEAGGFNVKVEKIADLDVAEKVAAEFQAAYGWEVLVGI
jgi:hypothetical protein